MAKSPLGKALQLQQDVEKDISEETVEGSELAEMGETLLILVFSLKKSILIMK